MGVWSSNRRMSVAPRLRRILKNLWSLLRLGLTKKLSLHSLGAQSGQLFHLFLTFSRLPDLQPRHLLDSLGGFDRRDTRAMEYSYNHFRASPGSKHAHQSPAVGSQEIMHNPSYIANPSSASFGLPWGTPDRRFLRPNLVRALKIGAEGGRARLKNFRALLTVGMTNEMQGSSTLGCHAPRRQSSKFLPAHDLISRAL
jgi:hypothetical protein